MHVPPQSHTTPAPYSLSSILNITSQLCSAAAVGSTHSLPLHTAVPSQSSVFVHVLASQTRLLQTPFGEQSSVFVQFSPTADFRVPEAVSELHPTMADATNTVAARVATILMTTESITAATGGATTCHTEVPVLDDHNGTPEPDASPTPAGIPHPLFCALRAQLAGWQRILRAGQEERLLRKRVVVTDVIEDTVFGLHIEARAPSNHDSEGVQ